MRRAREAFPERRHKADLCVVGGGMAGLCAAVAAARHGARVVLMHERPVLGGNSSSECRVHVCGADRHNGVKNMRETGILEEVRLENLYRNPQKSFSIWDMILYEKVKAERNITLLLNCSCLAAKMRGRRIESVTGWQLTTESWQTVEAGIYADCSGDGVLAPLTGAEWRMGREARAEFGESIAPAKKDGRTMGMTCLFHARRHEKPQPFEPAPWAHTFRKCGDLPYGAGHHRWIEMGYWWVELGGMGNTILDTEDLRDELLKITLGVWDHIKNRCPERTAAANWALDWLQFLPGERESRRFVGDHILTQRDIEAEGRFPDLVAYGGWTMDDHHPAGFWAVKTGHPATIFHRSPSPYGIPYRCLYSRNVGNLMFAGRNASCTHAAMSSTRVMGTGSVMGQAVGTAAALAARRKTTPRGVGKHISELQDLLQADDCYLPWRRQPVPELTRRGRLSASRGDPSPLLDGVNRPVGSDPHRWECRPGDHVSLTFDRPEKVREAVLVLDSGLDRDIAMSFHNPGQIAGMPPAMPCDYRIFGLAGGKWEQLVKVERNRRRLVRLRIGRRLSGVRFVLDRTWGSATSGLHVFYAD